MKIDWKSVNENMIMAIGSAIVACLGGTLLAGAGWIMLWMFKALVAMIGSI